MQSQGEITLTNNINQELIHLISYPTHDIKCAKVETSRHVNEHRTCGEPGEQQIHIL